MLHYILIIDRSNQLRYSKVLGIFHGEIVIKDTSILLSNNTGNIKYNLEANFTTFKFCNQKI